METIKQEKLLFNRPIEIEGLGTIYQPKMKDFVDNNFNISDMIRAFHINIKLVIPNADELRLSDFDLFFLQLHQTDKLEHLLIVDLIRSLEMLYKTSNIKVNIDNNEIKINDEYILNRDNYKLLCSYIMIIFDLDVNSIEKQQAKSAIELKIEQKRREFEKKKRKTIQIRKMKDILYLI